MKRFFIIFLLITAVLLSLSSCGSKTYSSWKKDDTPERKSNFGDYIKERFSPDNNSSDSSESFGQKFLERIRIGGNSSETSSSDNNSDNNSIFSNIMRKASDIFSDDSSTKSSSKKLTNALNNYGTDKKVSKRRHGSEDYITVDVKYRKISNKTKNENISIIEDVPDNIKKVMDSEQPDTVLFIRPGESDLYAVDMVSESVLRTLLLNSVITEGKPYFLYSEPSYLLIYNGNLYRFYSDLNLIVEKNGKHEISQKDSDKILYILDNSK